MPIGIGIDSSDNIYVSDAALNRIQKFDSNGNYLLQFGSAGSGNGQFNMPYSVIYDSNFIFVSDGMNSRVQKFDLSGNYISQFGSNGTGDGQFQMIGMMTVDSAHNFYVADMGNPRV